MNPSLFLLWDDVKILIHVESETDGRNVWNSKFLPETESQNLYFAPTDTYSTFARYVKKRSLFFYRALWNGGTTEIYVGITAVHRRANVPLAAGAVFGGLAAAPDYDHVL
jgi:hypothetical protein